jgi:hypothetical protein
MCLECNYPGPDILCFLIPLLGFDVLSFMGKIAGNFIKSIWIPFICHGAMIQENPHGVCVWISTNYSAVDILCLPVPLLGRWPIFNAVLTLYNRS